MPTRTLKDIPHATCVKFKASADRDRRILNSEISMRQGQDIDRAALDPAGHAESLRAFSARLPPVTQERVARYKRQGRA